MSILKFASEFEALQHLSDLTGKRIKIALTEDEMKESNFIIKEKDVKDKDILEMFKNIAFDGEYWHDKNIENGDNIPDDLLLNVALNDKTVHQGILEDIDSDIKLENKNNEDVTYLEDMRENLIDLSKKLGLVF